MGEYEDDLIDSFLAKTIDFKMEMCEEITGDQYVCVSLWYVNNNGSYI